MRAQLGPHDAAPRDRDAGAAEDRAGPAGIGLGRVAERKRLGDRGRGKRVHFQPFYTKFLIRFPFFAKNPR